MCARSVLCERIELHDCILKLLSELKIYGKNKIKLHLVFAQRTNQMNNNIAKCENSVSPRMNTGSGDSSSSSFKINNNSPTDKLVLTARWQSAEK